MPADAVAGIVEAIAALMEAMLEALVLLIELAVELAFLAAELVLFLLGRSRRIGRPGWVVQRRESTAGRLKSLILAGLFLATTGYGLFQFFGYTRLSFTQEGFSRPDGVTVRLVRDGGNRDATIESGKLKVLRGRWDRLVVHDPRYRPADFAITGRKMELRLEKTQSTREAATEAVIDKAAELLRKKFGKPEETKTEG